MPLPRSTHPIVIRAWIAFAAAGLALMAAAWQIPGWPVWLIPTGYVATLIGGAGVLLGTALAPRVRSDTMPVTCRPIAVEFDERRLVPSR